ncbi:YceI family protein [Paraflavisolibacter sp. H34]|uniref:YceI family protein n=1 Tax=Huijunlia imazamoxiresistens TaxID=3127457 RepID=UPI0030192FDB
MTRKTPLLYGMILLLAACTNAPESDKAATSDAKEVTAHSADESWQVNTRESKVEWIGTKVTGYHTGEVPVKSGEIFVKDGAVTGGKFVMDLANLTVSGPKDVSPSSNAKLLGHLKSADFFEVEKHPEATFELTGLKPFEGAVQDTADPRQETIGKYKVEHPTHTVSGNLTIKNITKNIEFPARITVSGNTAEAIAKFNIDRQQWNITYPGKPDDLIRKDIHLGIAIRAVK